MLTWWLPGCNEHFLDTLVDFKEENDKYPTCIGAVSFTTSYIFLVIDFLAISTWVLEPSEISSK